MLLSWFYLFLGVAVMLFGAEWLVRGASRLALALGISPLIIGLTVVAFGTSAPELAVSVLASYRGQPDLAVGNVVGSNIFNILVIVGIAALVVPLQVHSQLVRFDVPLMILLSAIVWVAAGDGNISRPEAVLLLLGVLSYTVFLIRKSRQESRAVVQEFAEEIGPPEPKDAAHTVKNLVLLVVGLALLVLGSHLIVLGSVQIARGFGVSELIVGLTIVAAGTSLPEAATSIIAAYKGERDIAVGNAVGSNLFNLMAVLGLAGTISAQGLPVASQALHVDFPVMFAVACVCLPVFYSQFTITRFDGLLFVLAYVGYTVYLILQANAHPFFETYHRWSVQILGPLWLIFLVAPAVLFTFRRRAPKATSADPS